MKHEQTSFNNAGMRPTHDRDTHVARYYALQVKERIIRGQPLYPWQEGYQVIWVNEPDRRQGSAGMRAPRMMFSPSSAQPGRGPRPDAQQYQRSSRRSEAPSSEPSEQEASVRRRLEQLQDQITRLEQQLAALLSVIEHE